MSLIDLDIEMGRRRQRDRGSMSGILTKHLLFCGNTDWVIPQAYWDPENIFSHCQSVGSSDNECCPFTLSRPQGPSP